MKAKTILLASVLLVDCQSTGNVQQHAQSPSAAGQGEAAKLTGQTRWMDDGTFTAPDGDLWIFINDELKIGIPENNRIREQKQKYLRNKSYLHDVTLQAEPYMYWIAGQVKRRNMPMELVLLPIVESAFGPHTTSGANAVGIWRVIPGTGRNYSLRQTRNYDARRDVAASTTAAPSIMQHLSEMFDGDWLLTIVTYNSGEGRVMKVIKTNKARGKSTDFWSLPLPQETKRYIPKMLTLNDIFKNSKRCDVRLPTTDESHALVRVYLSSPVEIARVTDMAGIPVGKLKALNADMKGSALGASGPQYVVVPKKHADQLHESLASGETATVQSTLIADNTPPSSRVYTIRSGNTLSNIASRLDVNTKDLQQWNKLRGSKLKPGQSLTIDAGSSTQRLADSSDSITYRVRKGDSLSSIAKRHGMSIKDVMHWNSDAVNLQPGDRLTLSMKDNNMPNSRQTR